MRTPHRFRWAAAAALAVGLALAPRPAVAADRDALFQVPDFQALPPAVEVISEKTTDGVHVMEFYFAGAPFAGKPTRIYAFYARPVADGRYPGVVQLHGAGLATLEPKAAEFYARNGFACILIDWCGPAKGRKVPRQPPYSEFESPGNLAGPLIDQGAGDSQRKGFQTYGPEVDGVTNGVRFVRRAFLFLRSRPEVAPDQLFLSGMSAGAHLSLLVLGQESGIRGAVVKYGCAFIRDLPGYFGGYFGPITLAPKEQQDAWLGVLDPKHGLTRYHSSVLMLSGTDDIFFWMPVVLHTWRAIPSPKALVMLPNDNHSQVGNEEIPLRYFRSLLGTAPAYPTVSAPTATPRDGRLALAVQVNGPSAAKQVAYWVKRMPVGKFHFGKTEGAKWESFPAAQAGAAWEASVPAPAAGEQLVAYAMVEDETGVKVSSDTVEVPDFPKWRGLPTPPAPAAAVPAPVPAPVAAPPPDTKSATAADGDLFLDPSFEERKTGKVGSVFLNFVNGPDWDGAPEHARTGSTSIRIGGVAGRNLTVGGPAQGGRNYRLAVYFRGERDGVRGQLQINWGRVDGGLIKYDLKTPMLLTEYQACEIRGPAPADAASALLIISTGSDPNETVWVDDIFFGEVP
ncbi:MAG: hypothetical protein A3K19_22950 [Lentisphaerae bacterium RIFOXYB12_FULL_65_16]|nr:MAG: hypothetical protein A3K18_16805 [Lentisphaerae bacterium RIFOXYA12_64_32]OGV90068.1 MAG: hypothetical protein A3K19_22950 [Lentisphaerae bacterium RIFOXYB12_FULL_65_16]